MLVDPAHTNHAIDTTSWIGQDVGSVSVWDNGEFESGLYASERGVDVEFFVQVREPSGATRPILEISHPFLWYWDAYPTDDGGWRYLNRAHRPQALLRSTIDADSWKVEVRALEFRHYLAACGRSAIIQVDRVLKVDSSPFERVDDVFGNDWAKFEFYALHESAMGTNPSYSRILGQYVVDGQKTSRPPRFEERNSPREFPEFIYGIDDDGNPLTHTCDPSELGSYFDEDAAKSRRCLPTSRLALCHRRQL